MTPRWVQESTEAGLLQSLQEANNRLIYRPLPFSLPLRGMADVMCVRPGLQLGQHSRSCMKHASAAAVVPSVGPPVLQARSDILQVGRSSNGCAKVCRIMRSQGKKRVPADAYAHWRRTQAVRERIWQRGEAVPDTAGQDDGRALHRIYDLLQHPPPGALLIQTWLLAVAS